jgi:hypothetical protein
MTIHVFFEEDSTRHDNPTQIVAIKPSFKY